MPRFVRPSFLIASADGVAGKVATGPKSRTGTLSATFLVRDQGSVLPLLEVDAIASRDGETVLYRVTDKRSGAVVFEEKFTQ